MHHGDRRDFKANFVPPDLRRLSTDHRAIDFLRDLGSSSFLERYFDYLLGQATRFV